MRQTIKAYMISPWTIENGVMKAPVVLIREGVACGSNGCIFWAGHILQENAHKWDNVPVCIDHPQVDGIPVSIEENAETRRAIIGATKNPRYDPAIKGIRAEIHVPASHPRASEIQGIREVSMGVFSDETYESGEFKGKEYSACSITMEPDHCALLSGGQVGACDWETGCGIRNNSKSRAFQDIIREAAKNHFQTLIRRKIMHTNEVKPLLPPGVKEVEKEFDYSKNQWEGEVEPMLPPVFDRKPNNENENQNETKNETWNGGNDEVQPMLPPQFNR
jgi:hypothetical protein